MPGEKKLAVFGGAGATGQQLVRQALDRGHRVRALEPAWDGAPEMPHGVETATADITEPGLDAHFKGCDAVISAIGIGFGPETAANPPPLYTEGAVQTLAGMKEAGVTRLIVVSASFVAERDRGPVWFRAAAKLALDRIFTQMQDMERVLRASDGIDWTAVRPGWLMDGDLTRDYTVTEDAIPEHLIRTRHADLAHFMLDCLDDDLWIGKTPAIARDEPRSASSLDKLVAELIG